MLWKKKWVWYNLDDDHDGNLLNILLLFGTRFPRQLLFLFFESLFFLLLSGISGELDFEE